MVSQDTLNGSELRSDCDLRKPVTINGQKVLIYKKKTIMNDLLCVGLHDTSTVWIIFLTQHAPKGFLPYYHTHTHILICIFIHVYWHLE